MAEIIYPLGDFVLPALPRHILVINLRSPATIQERFVGRQGYLKTGNLVILPAGAPTSWYIEHEGEAHHLHLYLSPFASCDGLLSNEENWRVLAEMLPQFVWIARSEDGWTDYVNQQFCAYTHAQLQGSGWSQFLHPEDCAHTPPGRAREGCKWAR